MKIGDKVALVKEITFDGGSLPEGTEGEVSNILPVDGVDYVVLVVEDPIRVFVLKADSVK